MSLSPEELKDKIKEGLRKQFPLALEHSKGWLWCYENLIADIALRVVLQAIKYGEVVEYIPKYDDGVIGDIVLKPDFQKWMENK